MTCSKPIKITIDNKDTISFHYAFNQNTTFNDLIEFTAYYFPDIEICPCYKIQIKNESKINNDCKVIDYIVKYSNFQLNNSDPNKKCSCNPLFKDCFKKSKVDIMQKFSEELQSEKKISIEDFDKEKKKLEKIIENLNEKISILTDENEKLNKKIINLETEIKTKNNEIDQCNIENNNKLEQIKKLEQKNKSLELAINGDPDTIDQLINLGIINANIAQKENSNIKIDPKTNEIKGNNNPNLQPNFINFYDVIIDIKSIKDIYKGWEIKRSKRAETNYDDFKKDRIIKIGVIGNSNKGKSFLLSKISKIDLPSGTSIRTEGLSIKYPELDLFKDRKIALLDSAGLETPVLKQDEELIKEEKEKEKESESEKETNDEIEEEKKTDKELFKEKSREKLITELFLQNYIINNSDILLAVVGILTYSEQKLLNRIKTEIQRAKINKTLFIVHNLITYTSVDQVKDYINTCLFKSATFHLEEGQKISTKIQQKDGVFFYEKNTDPKIYHLIFANEGSEAGKYYNQFTLEFLEGEFQRVTDLKPFDVIQTVKQRFVETSKDFLEKMEKPLDLNDFDNSSNKLIKITKKSNIKLKKCLIDELGFSNLKANGFEPTYNYYKKDDKIIIRLEAPGNTSIKTNIEAMGEYKIIRLIGNKRKDKEPEKIEDNIFNSRESGPFTLDIPLKNEDFLIRNEPPKYSDKKGIIILEFQLEDKLLDKGYNPDEEEEI